MAVEVARHMYCKGWIATWSAPVALSVGGQPSLGKLRGRGFGSDYCLSGVAEKCDDESEPIPMKGVTDGAVEDSLG